MNIETAGIIYVHNKEGSITYVNQTGGYSCNQREATGTFYKLHNHEKIDDLLYEHFFSGPHGGWCQVSTGGLTEDDAKFVDELIGPYYSVNRDKLKQSEEAWVYLQLNDIDRDYDVTDYILVWGNSD